MSNSTSPDRELQDMLDALLRKVGGDPEHRDALYIREALHTCLKLVRDKADVGELKLVSRSLKELRYAMKVFRPYADVPKITIFGSARTQETNPQYRAAMEFARLMSVAGWMVITGAGDGIMAAGHGGAGRQKSFGVSIRLPFETNANKYIVGDPKLVTFRYFFTRKLMFMSQARAVALFPGGFGTHDEGFEALTLVQTGKAQMLPIVMVDEPSGAYWYYWQDYVRHHLLETGLISPEDLNLYFITDDPQKAVNHVLHFYKNYHSMRFVRDEMVIRLKSKLAPAQLEELNDDFARLVASGKIEQSAALEEETDALDLPRLRYVSTRRDYGLLRRMIDRINDFG